MLLLYVDDDVEDYEIFSGIVLNIDPDIEVKHIESCDNLLNALDLFTAIPHYIFLDVYMPRQKGMDCLRDLKNSERYKSIPVIIYSSVINERNVAYCERLGASGFLTKSSNYTEAVRTLQAAFQTILK